MLFLVLSDIYCGFNLFTFNMQMFSENKPVLKQNIKKNELFFEQIIRRISIE
jgi:hypothetical protein